MCSSQCQSELTITVLSFSLSRISYFIHTRWYQSNCNLCQSYSGEKWDKCTQKYIDTLYQQCGDSFSIRKTHWEVIVSYEYLHTHVHVPISRNQKALVTHKVSVFLLNDEQIKRFASLNDLKPLKLQNHKVKKQADTGQIIHECIVARAWLWLMYITNLLHEIGIGDRTVLLFIKRERRRKNCTHEMMLKMNWMYRDNNYTFWCAVCSVHILC